MEKLPVRVASIVIFSVTLCALIIGIFGGTVLTTVFLIMGKWGACASSAAIGWPALFIGVCGWIQTINREFLQSELENLSWKNYHLDSLNQDLRAEARARRKKIEALERELGKQQGVTRIIVRDLKTAERRTRSLVRRERRFEPN